MTARATLLIGAFTLAGALAALPAEHAQAAEDCVGVRFPAPRCTGVPAGVTLKRVIRGDYTARKPRQIIDRWRITGSLVIAAPGVTVRRSRIDGSVTNDTGGAVHPFSISDSIVGPAVCGTPTARPMAVGSSRYKATRVHVRGHQDGFRASGANVTIRHSYYKACALPGAHADGIQDYPAAQNLVIDHNTFDMGHLKADFNAPIFVASDNTTDVTIVNNLALGGVYSVFIKPRRGKWVVRGNRVAVGTWAYGPYEAFGGCGNVSQWQANTVVRVDSRYRIRSKVRTVACPR